MLDGRQHFRLKYIFSYTNSDFGVVRREFRSTRRHYSPIRALRVILDSPHPHPNISYPNPNIYNTGGANVSFSRYVFPALAREKIFDLDTFFLPTGPQHVTHRAAAGAARASHPAALNRKSHSVALFSHLFLQ